MIYRTLLMGSLFLSCLFFYNNAVKNILGHFLLHYLSLSVG